MRKFLASGLGTGFLWPPGTWGSLGAAGAVLLTAWLSGRTPWAVWMVAAGIAVATSILCVALGPYSERTFGKKDPRQNTLDEWAGQGLAVIALPLGQTWSHCLIALGGAFVAFRFFDIVKPPPARQLENLPQGWGVLADDLAAGIYANLVMQVVLRLWVLP